MYLGLYTPSYCGKSPTENDSIHYNIYFHVILPECLIIEQIARGVYRFNVVILDLKERVEIELWLKPDGIVFNDDTLKRRRKVKLNLDVEACIVSPEDFIINKLARPDRGVNDEQDVKSVLVRQEGRLDKEYLTRRAEKVGVLQVLNNIEAHSS